MQNLPTSPSARRPRGRRSAVTLVEGILASVLLTLTMAIFWNVYSSARRQGDQVGKGAELMQAASLIQEVLAWDLLRSLPADSMQDRPLLRGMSESTLVLPYYVGYDGTLPDARKYAELKYRFDAERGALYRADKPLVQAGLSAVKFRWSKARPTMLEVLLVGRKSAGSKAARFVIRLPAPRGTDGSRHWQLAKHHRGATHAEPTPGEESP